MMLKFHSPWILLFGLAILGGASSAFAQSAATCMAPNQEADVKISDLHPTQPNVGLGEVLKKSKDLVGVDPTQGNLDDGDPVPVVVGPDGKLYVSDHHHFVLALLLAKNSDALVHVKTIENSFCGSCSPSNSQCIQDFWKHMTQAHLAYLCSNHDQPVRFSEIPESFGPDAVPVPLANDPYRTLVNVMRKVPPSYDPKKKPCLVRPTDDASAFFWEFRMAEKIRRHIPTEKDAELLSPQNAKTTKIPQDIIDAACTAWSQDSSDESCASKIAADPGLVAKGKSGASGASRLPAAGSPHRY